MTPAFDRLKLALASAGIDFTLTHHSPVYTSAEAAAVRGVSLHSGAKALILKGEEPLPPSPSRGPEGATLTCVREGADPTGDPGTRGRGDAVIPRGGGATQNGVGTANEGGTVKRSAAELGSGDQNRDRKGAEPPASPDSEPSLFFMAVIPADLALDSHALRKHLGAKRLRFATKEEVLDLTGLTPGSIPPFGSLFGLATICDTRLQENARINFNAASHTDSIQMSYADYLRYELPTLAEIAKPGT